MSEIPADMKKKMIRAVLKASAMFPSDLREEKKLPEELCIGGIIEQVMPMPFYNRAIRTDPVAYIFISDTDKSEGVSCVQEVFHKFKDLLEPQKAVLARCLVDFFPSPDDGITRVCRAFWFEPLDLESDSQGENS